MTGAARAGALIARLHRVGTAAEEARLIAGLRSCAEPMILGFVNAHAVNIAWRDAEAARAFAGADMLLRDGAGMALLDRAAGRDPGRNMNGTDLIPRLIGARLGQGIALYGTREPWLGAARARLEAGGHRVISTLDGFRAPQVYLEDAARTRPDVIVLAMGMPRQEQLALRLRAALDHPVLIVCGGAIVDFLGGRFARAPGWMRRAGLEWLWRLGREPRRLFTRYVIGNALFVARIPALTRARAR